MKSVHILLVEDNEGDIRLTQEAFRDSRIVNLLSVARNGEEALDFIYQRGGFKGQEVPDLILLDINLPLMNGDEVLRTLKSDDAVKHIPVIILTTSSSDADIRSSYQNYANAYITKPVDIHEFLDAIKTLETFWVKIVQLPG